MDSSNPTTMDITVNITAWMTDSSSYTDVSDEADYIFHPPTRYMKKVWRLDNKVKKLSRPQPEVPRINRYKQNTTSPKPS